MAARTVFYLLLIAVFLGDTGMAADIIAPTADRPSARPSSLPDRYPAFVEFLRQQAAPLEAVSSDQEALALFQDLGPLIGLKDAAITVAAKNLPGSLAKELLLEDVKRAAVDLVNGLAAWQLAIGMRAAESATAPATPGLAETHAAWLIDKFDPEHPVRRLVRLAQQPPQDNGSGGSATPAESVTPVLVSAAAAEAWATDRVSREWFRLYNWKDTVRQQRALARLCGTWQWMIHNHQNHREEKTSIIFPPPGMEASMGPAEIIAVGDLVYLRWETRAGVQEDSLLFTGEGQRLEGTFVNSVGGWGSITGKQTASCAKASGEKPSATPRRHH
jgi:hypothetical protein